MSVETLAQALQEAGILDSTAVNARLPRVRTGRALLEGIIADGLSTEANLVAQLARALSVPRYDPKERSPEPEAIALLDARQSDELGVLPVAVRGNGALLWVALCDPTDEGLLGEVARRTGRRVKACLIGPRELAKAQQQLGQGGGSMPLQMPQPPQQPMQMQMPPQPMQQMQQMQQMPNPGVSGQFRVPFPSGMNGQQMPGMGYPNMMPNGTPQQMMGSMPPMPGNPYGQPYGYGQQMMGTMPPPGSMGPPQGMGQPMQMQSPPSPMGLPSMGTMPPGMTPNGALSSGPQSRDMARLEEELTQAKQVVKVLAQLLVERNLIDGEELKRRLRTERERK